MLQTFYRWTNRPEDEASLHIVGRSYWHGDLVAVEETCLVCGNKCIGAWELSFRWGDDKNASEYISEVCWKCYEQVWGLCANTDGKPFKDWCRRPLNEKE